MRGLSFLGSQYSIWPKFRVVKPLNGGTGTAHRARRLSRGGQVYEQGHPRCLAHFWTFDGKQFTSVYQVMDSAAWHAAVQA
ncbi:MAG: hypothetical protein EOO23_09390 [Comamonadaceae bacterium]|nr:MAG: hypothetical protein EOO23_09390 [Comamonadaceae bacterium]